MGPKKTLFYFYMVPMYQKMVPIASKGPSAIYGTKKGLCFISFGPNVSYSGHNVFYGTNRTLFEPYTVPMCLIWSQWSLKKVEKKLGTGYYGFGSLYLTKNVHVVQ